MQVGTIFIYDQLDFPKTNKFIFHITAYHSKCGRQYPQKIKIFKIGYFGSLKSAENYITEYCLKNKRGKDWDKTLHHFEIEKLPLDSELQTTLGYWIYDKNARLFQSYPDTHAPFLGIIENDRKFRKADIVEILANGKLELGIIVAIPKTPEEIERRKKRCVETNFAVYENDFTDFFFYTIYYKKGITAENIIKGKGEYYNEYSHGLNIFPISGAIDDYQKTLLEELYHLYQAPHEV